MEFKIDYSGGWGTFHKPIWKTMKNRLPAVRRARRCPGCVKACKAPDGSYWALQVWQRMLPNLGMTPWRTSQKAWELHISHWSGELPVVEMYLDWIYSQKFHHLFGRFTYKGVPVHGFKATSERQPARHYGRNIYVDTYNSAYGKGWKRENSFLMHNPRGNFCYGFYMHDRYPGYPRGPKRPKGHGSKYRWTIDGPRRDAGGRRADDGSRGLQPVESEPRLVRGRDERPRRHDPRLGSEVRRALSVQH